MLETIRAYAEGVLDDASEQDGLRRRLAQHVVALARETRAGLRLGDAADMFARIDAELANVRSARSWLEERSHRDELCELVYATTLYWSLRGFLREGLLWAEKALAMSDRRDFKQAGVLFAAASFAADLGDLMGAKIYSEESLAIRREVGGAGDVASGLGGLARILADLGDHDEAEGALEEAAALARQEGRDDLAGFTLANMSDLALRRHDYERARRASAEALALFRGLDDKLAIGWASTTSPLRTTAKGTTRRRASTPVRASLPRTTSETRLWWCRRSISLPPCSHIGTTWRRRERSWGRQTLWSSNLASRSGVPRQSSASVPSWLFEMACSPNDMPLLTREALQWHSTKPSSAHSPP